MAIPTPVNGQITDAVTQANLEVVATAPAQAMAALYQSMAQAAALAATNANNAQQNMQTVSEAATTLCVQSLLGTSDKK